MIDIVELQQAIHDIRPFTEVTIRFGKQREGVPFEVILEFKVYHRNRVYYSYLHISGLIWEYWTVKLIGNWFTREFDWVK